MSVRITAAAHVSRIGADGIVLKDMGAVVEELMAEQFVRMGLELSFNESKAEFAPVWLPDSIVWKRKAQ